MTLAGIVLVVAAAVGVTGAPLVWWHVKRGPVGAAVVPRTVAPVVVAVVLACLGGLATGLSALGDTGVLSRGYSAGLVAPYFVRPQGWLRGYYWSAVVTDPVTALLLIGGAMLLAARRRCGQVALTAGCALVIGLGSFGAVVKPDLLGAGPSGPLDRAIRLALLAFPVGVVVLAWSPATTRWCRSGPGHERSAGPAGT